MFKLSNGKEVEIEKCQKCDHDMVNVDRDQVTESDVINLRNKGIRISNPDTEDLICLVCHAQHFVDWYNEPKKEKEEDSYHSSSISSLGSIGGFFGGGFGGFGGGKMSGGGASSGW